MKSDHGKVEILSVPDWPSLPTAGTGGPSIPEPVVHPLPVAALNTSPIAASLERGEMEKQRLVGTGERLKLSSLDDDLDCDSESLLPSSRLEEGRRKWKVFLEEERDDDDDDDDDVLVEEGKMEKEGRVVVATEDELKHSIIIRLILNLKNKTKQNTSSLHL